MTDHLKGDDFEDMEAWREWSSNKPAMAQLNADLLKWWSKGQRMSTEISRLKAELEEAREILTEVFNERSRVVAALSALGAKPEHTGWMERARAFLNKLQRQTEEAAGR